LEVDEDGFVVRIDEWDVHMSEQLGSKEGMQELSGEHLKHIAALSLCCERHRQSPLCRDILVETRFAKMDMKRLFPFVGYRRPYKLASLTKPSEC